MRTRSIKVSTTAVGNVGTGEDNLITFALPGNVLYTNNDGFRFVMAGTFAANANNKQVRAYFGATIIGNTGVIAHNGGAWRIEGEVLRTGATAQISNTIITYTTAAGVSTAGTMYATPAETLANAITLKATGEATSNDDIIQKYLVVSPIAYSAA